MTIRNISDAHKSPQSPTGPSWVLSTKSNVDTQSSDDWSAIGARMADVPSRATIRGMFMRQACAWIPGANAARYQPFANYSLRDYMGILLEAAANRYPYESPSDALVRLGFEVYPLFASSLVGGVIFGIANNACRHVVELSPKAYPVTLSPGHVNVVRCDSSSAIVELRDVWAFPELFHAGIWLGAMKVCRAEGTLAVTRHSPCDADFALQWRARVN